jgi:hypothetical protein
MKYNSMYILAAVIIGLFVVLSLVMGTCNVQPYSSDSLFKHEYPYEGFETKKENMKDGDKKVEGFEGLMPAPFAENKMLDPFFKAETKPECQGSGLTKGNGSLCLTPELEMLLKTRGKNATGGESQIGN